MQSDPLDTSVQPACIALWSWSQHRWWCQRDRACSPPSIRQGNTSQRGRPCKHPDPCCCHSRACICTPVCLTRNLHFVGLGKTLPRRKEHMLPAAHPHTWCLSAPKSWLAAHDCVMPASHPPAWSPANCLCKVQAPLKQKGTDAPRHVSQLQSQLQANARHELLSNLSLLVSCAFTAAQARQAVLAASRGA